jgi:hypothetical protein
MKSCTNLVLGAASDKLPFTLIANIATISDSSCDVNLTSKEFNPMMAMMIKGPIGKFDALATNMTKL